MPTILLLVGKVNFTNLSRYSEYSERTYRRHYAQAFPFVELNGLMIPDGSVKPRIQLGSMDCSFIGKSGKLTYGLDWFYNGSAQRTQKGLEISLIAVIDLATHQAYSLSVQQTPAPVSSAVRINHDTLEQARQTLQNLGPKSSVSRSSLPQAISPDTLRQAEARLNALPPVPSHLTRIDHYLAHLQATRPFVPKTVKYWVVDGFYSKQKFVDGVVALEFELVSKLRADANLRYLYEGVQKPRGAKRKYDGKVQLADLRRFQFVEQLESGLQRYTAVVWHVSLKRCIRVACLVNTRKAEKTGYVLLYSTDLSLDAKVIVDYYQARFQIEFIFRDAKQFTGLCDCQARDAKKLEFHFNACLSALNLAKYEIRLQQEQENGEPTVEPFSMASYKRMALNDHLLERFISKLELDPMLIKSHPNYPDLRSYGVLAP